MEYPINKCLIRGLNFKVKSEDQGVWPTNKNSDDCLPSRSKHCKQTLIILYLFSLRFIPSTDFVTLLLISPHSSLENDVFSNDKHLGTRLQTFYHIITKGSAFVYVFSYKMAWFAASSG